MAGLGDFILKTIGVADMSQVQEEVKKTTTNATNKITGMLSGVQNAVAAGAVASLAGMGIAIAASAAAAVKFQNDFAAVKKTMSDVESPEVFQKIADDLLKLSTQIPITSEELTKIAAVGGQLGVGADDISQFTEVVAKLGGATNMSFEQAATSMARFLNVTNESISSIDQFASVLVELGNNTAAQEGEILMLAQRFGAVGDLAGLSTEEILAFSAAMRETGQQSQAGATALNRLFRQLRDSAVLGGEELSTFAEVAGTDIDTFRRLIEDDVGEAAAIFLSGINSMNASGQSVTGTLDDLELGTARISQAILSLAANEEGLAEARQRAKDEAIEQNALNEEAAEKFGTVTMQAAQLKTTLSAAAATLGEVFIPVLEAVLVPLNDFARGLFDVAQGLREAPEALFGFIGGLTGLTAIMGKTVLSGTFLGSMLKSVAKALTRMFLPATLVIGAFTALGKLLAKIGRDSKALKDLEGLTDTVAKSMEGIAVALDSAFSSDPIDAETWEAFLENLPTATQDAVRKGIEEGSISADIAEQILNSPEIPDAIKDVLFDGLDKGAEGIIGTIADFKTDSGDLFRSAEMLEGLENDMLQPIIAQIQKVAVLTEQKEKGTLRSVEELETQTQILDVMLAINEVGQQKRLATDKEIRNLILEHVGGLMQMSAEERDLFRTEEGRLELAKKYAPYSEDLTRALKGQKKLQEDITEEVEEQVTTLDALVASANDLRTKIANIYAPIKEQFELEENQMDLTEALEEHQKLHEEEHELTKEDLQLQQDLIDLKAKDIETAEEKLEIQKLENEALEIEKKIRDGMALSNEDFLKKEKLKKDLVKLNAAIAQGSIEFPERERGFIQDQIDAIDKKALTQKDADEKREKAQEIMVTAQERRAQAINDIEERRIEIEERLAEIPREIFDAHQEIHDLQFDLLNNQLDMIEAMQKYKNETKETVVELAKLFGLDTSALTGPMSLYGQLESETLPKMTGFVDNATANANKIARVGQYGASGNHGSNLKNLSIYGYEPMAIGGHFKGGRNYLVGEQGPELMKAFPGGGGMITPMGKSSGGDTTNYVTLNVTGLPSDPISARRTAQLIQKELNKLKGDGRSGIIR